MVGQVATGVLGLELDTRLLAGSSQLSQARTGYVVGLRGTDGCCRRKGRTGHNDPWISLSRYLSTYL